MEELTGTIVVGGSKTFSGTFIRKEEIATLQSVINRAIDFIEQNEATFGRMEVAEYDTLADAVKPYRSK